MHHYLKINTYHGFDPLLSCSDILKLKDIDENVSNIINAMKKYILGFAFILPEFNTKLKTRLLFCVALMTSGY